ncbi:phage virion morphogenesis protein [Elioraea sp.]|uniref:phage virion morphogenesis protein n=1 Tax=Elioraea sp. TaxID=2185103 RepID=UPI0025C6B11B|nr:phage virion morphogenesis protein [Elioraea sp.]
MVARVDITVNDAEIASALGRAAAATRDLTSLMDQIGASLVASTQFRFETARGPVGVPWKRSARAASVGGQTLVDSGRLRASITHRPSSDRVEVGSNLVYAGVHQLGATIRAKTSKGLRFRIGDKFVVRRQVTIPARPFLGVDAEDRAEIVAITTDWLRDRLARGGGQA